MGLDNGRTKFRMRAHLIRGYQNAKQLCLPIDCVFMCFDLAPMCL